MNEVDRAPFGIVPQAIEIAIAAHERLRPGGSAFWSELPDDVKTLAIVAARDGLAATPVTQAPNQGVQALADRSADGEAVLAKAETYDHMHEIAVGLGYPSILQALEDLDRFLRPAHRDLSTSDPITPLRDFRPDYLRGLALTFREWCHSEIWGAPGQAEHAARLLETAFLALTSHAGEVRALSDVATERARQQSVEGWTPEHDDSHASDGFLPRAAACYALAGMGANGPFWVNHLQVPQQVWPYRWEWKPKDRRRNLIRAAALLVAEIERLDRAALAQPEAALSPTEDGAIDASGREGNG